MSSSAPGRGEYGTLGRLGLEIALTAGIGERDEDHAPVVGAGGALDEAVALHAGDQPGGGALAQVHGLGEFDAAALPLRAGGEAFEGLELGDADVVPPPQLGLEGTT